MLKITTILAAALLCVATSAQAMPPTSDARAALVLAQTCVKEAGWEVTADCAAIHAVLQKRAAMGRMRFEAMAARYSRPSMTKPWLQQLDAIGSRPANWPVNVHWGKVHREKWLALLDHAEDIIAGQISPECDPDHWGDAHTDHDRAVRNGWTQIECGDTRNEFWSVARGPE